jgi:S1-C subfamily serine protease
MFCPACGTQLPDGSAFCLKCGRPMPVAPIASPVPVNEPKQTVGVKALIAMLGLVGLLVAGWVAYFTKGRAEGIVSQPSHDSSSQAKSARANSTNEPPAPVKLSPGEIAAKYADAVVVLESYNDQGQKQSQGSGFIVSDRGEVFTNYHVIRGSARMVARTHDDTSHEVEYITGFTPEHDVAALRIEGASLPFVHLGSSDGVKAGDHVTVVGAPLGLESTVSDGIISAVRGTNAFHIFQTSAPISHGSSGGPLFDDYGNVVALAVATIEQGENLNFAVPIDSAKALLSNQQHMSFTELLQSTAVHQPILSSSISIPPQVVGLDIAVPQQGGLLTGSFSIVGGFGNDLGVSLMSVTGGVIWIQVLVLAREWRFKSSHPHQVTK